MYLNRIHLPVFILIILLPVAAFAQDTTLTVTKDGNVGIGTTTPTAKLHVDGSIKSSMWNVTQLFKQETGALPKQRSFTSGGGILLIFVSGSGFTGTSAKIIGMTIYVDDVEVGTAKVFTNEIKSHKAFAANVIVANGIVAGLHELKFVARVGTETSGADFFSAVVLELPF